MHFGVSGSTPPLTEGQEKLVATFGVITRVRMGKTFPLLMDRRKVVCDIWSHPLEIMLVRLPFDDGQE